MGIFPDNLDLIGLIYGIGTSNQSVPMAIEILIHRQWNPQKTVPSMTSTGFGRPSKLMVPQAESSAPLGEILGLGCFKYVLNGV